VRVNCLEPFDLSVTEADMAIRLAKAFGATADVWIRMQGAYDLAQARLHEGDISVERFKPRAA